MVTTTTSPALPWTTRLRQQVNALPRESRDTLFLLLVVDHYLKFGLGTVG